MINIGQYGWEIHIFKAATIVGKNIGIRDHYDFTKSMLHHSLFSDWLKKHGMRTGRKDESTRDIICIDFQFGLRSYEEEKAHLREMRRKAEKEEDEEVRIEKLKKLDSLDAKVEENKYLYRKMTKDDIRRYLYENGADITYTHYDKKLDKIIEDETIHYKMLYRNPSKAKEGSSYFINEKLYDVAYKWITMGVGLKLPEHNVPIVEISAYASLVASSIEGTVHVPMEEVLIVSDQKSYFNTLADIIRTEDYDVYEQVVNPETNKKETKLVTKKKCVIHREYTDVCNDIWDGMALIEGSVMPDWCNGMALLRNHFFKACAFRANIQLFFMDYCRSNNIDYETYEIEDMFGVKHLAKNVKILTTANACKWLKFQNIIGEGKKGYDYWCRKVSYDGCVWGIVKTDHPSKLGDYQQISYQVANSLPCNEEEMYKIAGISAKYVELIKSNNDEFEKFLRKNANFANSYEMLADLYAWNHNIENSKYFRMYKRTIINEYVTKLKKGKIFVPGDNLTVCGNPYALLLHSVGEDWSKDPTLRPEKGVIQVYTSRFEDGEYLCGIRNPHNASNNIGYFKNVRHPLMEKYFPFSKNVMAVNCIETDCQSRLNGEDFDSDFNLVTNQPEMVKAAKIAYEKYPTVVNEVSESKSSYNNTLADYARMDSIMQAAQKAIGGSSDSAQLSQSYMWDKVAKNEIDDEYQQLYENTAILAVLAQLAIDGCKKVFEIDVNEEIKRIRAQECMTKEKPFPKFMQYTHKIPVTKNGRERPYEDIKKDKDKVKNRIDESIVCPMNWVVDCLSKIQGIEADRRSYVPTVDYLIDKPDIRSHDKQIAKIRKIISEFADFSRGYIIESKDKQFDDEINLLKDKSEEVFQAVSKFKINNATMYRLIESALSYETASLKYRKYATYRLASKYVTATLNVLYHANKEKFLGIFRQNTLF